MNKDISNLTPVFRLKPLRYNKNDDGDDANADIKFIDYVHDTQKLGDEPVELDVSEDIKKLYNSHTDYIANIDKYDIKVSAYRNNMTGNFMISTKTMPICSLNFMYSKNIVVGYLFNIYFCFSLHPFKNYFLKDPKSYNGARIYGKYMIYLESENDLKYEQLEKNIEQYAKHDVAKEIIDKNLTLSEEELLNMINKDIEEKKQFYKSLFDGIIIDSFKNIKKIYDLYLIPIYKNKHINSLIKFGLEMKQLKRQKEYGFTGEQYNIPTKVLKISDYKDNPDLIDKYLGIEENSDDE
jgi:hypothetical protein